MGFDVNPVLWDFYTNGAGKDYVHSPSKGTSLGDRSAWHINEVPVSLYSTNVKAADAAAGANITDVLPAFASYGDAAIVMLSVWPVRVLIWSTAILWMAPMCCP